VRTIIPEPSARLSMFVFSFHVLGTRLSLGGPREVGWVGDWRGDAVAFRFQPPPVEPGMRFSRTRLTDALHRRCSTGARQDRLGLGAMTIPLREIRPSVSRDR
jgi:hypothetical protein